MIDFPQWTDTVGGRFWDTYTAITTIYGQKSAETDETLERAKRLIALAPRATADASLWNLDPSPILAAKSFAQSFRKIGNKAKLPPMEMHHTLKEITERMHDIEMGLRKRERLVHPPEGECNAIRDSDEARQQFYAACVPSEDIIDVMLAELHRFHVPYWDRVRNAPIGPSPNPDWSNWENAIRGARLSRAAKVEPQIGATFHEWLRAVRMSATADNVPLAGLPDDLYKGLIETLKTEGKVVERDGVYLLTEFESPPNARGSDQVPARPEGISEAARPNDPQHGFKDFITASQAQRDFGVLSYELSRAAHDVPPRVRTCKAPPGVLDDRGKQIRKLYHRDDVRKLAK